MLGLTTLGIIHTAISLVALGAGFVALAKHREITPRTNAGRWFIWTTIITVLTGFPIMQHGGFGKPHILGVITLVVMAGAALAGRGKLGGKLAPYLEVVGYSATFFFHFIPAVNETFTRLPVGAPLATSDKDPIVQGFVGGFFLLFLIGATLQAVRLRAARAKVGGSRQAGWPTGAGAGGRSSGG